jgi:hypothetical protein
MQRNRDAHLEQLASTRFEESELEQFYEDFNETSGDGSGPPLSDAISAIGQSLEAISPGTLVRVSVI